MKISVTQEDIDNGAWRSCSECPIALAIRRATCLGPEQVEVRTKYVGLLKYHYTTQLPATAANFILLYDCIDTWQDCRPIEFELDIPQNCCRPQ